MLSECQHMIKGDPEMKKVLLTVTALIAVCALSDGAEARGGHGYHHGNGHGYGHHHGYRHGYGYGYGHRYGGYYGPYGGWYGGPTYVYGSGGYYGNPVGAAVANTVDTAAALPGAVVSGVANGIANAL